VQQIVRDLAEKVGLPQHVTPHVFRHSAATWMLRRGMNPLLVAQVLGHSPLDMIQKVYSHLTPNDAHRELMAALRGDREER
jgi:integrase